MRDAIAPTRFATKKPAGYRGDVKLHVPQYSHLVM